jgi:hypothetical protein
MLMEETRKAIAQPVVAHTRLELQTEIAARMAERKGHPRMAEWMRDSMRQLSVYEFERVAQENPPFSLKWPGQPTN